MLPQRHPVLVRGEDDRPVPRAEDPHLHNQEQFVVITDISLTTMAPRVIGDHSQSSPAATYHLQQIQFRQNARCHARVPSAGIVRSVLVRRKHQIERKIENHSRACGENRPLVRDIYSTLNTTSIGT